MTELYIMIISIACSFVILVFYVYYKAEYKPNLKDRLSMNSEINAYDDMVIKVHGNTYRINFFYSEKMEKRDQNLFPFVFETDDKNINLIYGKRSDQLVNDSFFVKFYTLMHQMKRSNKFRIYKIMFYLQILFFITLSIYAFVLGYLWVSLSFISFPSLILQLEYYIYVRVVKLKTIIKEAKENNIYKNDIITILNKTMNHQDTIEYYKRNKKYLHRLLKMY